jgi:oligoribonuclease NrnB/cAMP/cGMP phosphodiesterase (DHH superfamily)
MNNNQNIQVITHTDLDGVVSYLVLCWLYGKKLNVIGTTPMKLEQDYNKLVSSKKQWDKLYFLDLDVSKIGEQIDNKNTVILDHHKTNIYPFKNAVVRIYNETSCSKLIYDTFFKQIKKPLTNAQKTLIALADDWDSNTRQTPLSESLNVVYHSLTDKFNSFVEDYYEGFKPFDKFKENTITLYKKHRAEYLRELVPFIGEIEFEGQKGIKVGSVFCNKFVQECCDYLLNKFDVDVAIAVLIEQKRIAVRRNSKNNTIDVSKFAQRIASGGGHEAAAGGNLTEEFIEFTKMLKPLTS